MRAAVPRGLSGGQQLILCLSLATLLFLGQIGSWSDVRNRYYFHWQRSDAIVSMMGLLAIALLFFLLARVLQRIWPSRAGMILQWLTIILVADVLVGYGGARKIREWSPALAGAWTVVAAIGLLTSTRPAWQFAERGRRILMVLVWLAPISFGQMLLWDPWDVQPSIGQAAPVASENRTPVFIFVFDGWSRQRSYQDEQLLPFFHNVRILAARSLDFTQAHSQEGTTRLSLPQLLFQREGSLEVANGTTYWVEQNRTTLSSEVPSLFAAARARGYQTSLSGFYLPYRSILGNQVAQVTSYPHVPKGQTFLGRMVIAAIRNLHFLSDPVSQLLWLKWYSRAYNENWARIHYALRDDVRALIRQSNRSTFALVHSPLPHPPFVFNEDGSYRAASTRAETVAGYRRELHVLDLAIGDILTEMEAVGVLDPALVIITSDHSWKAEPDASLNNVPARLTWVPLFVKLPHQRAGHEVSQPFCLGQIGALVQRVIDTTLTEQNIFEELSGLPSMHSCTQTDGSPSD